MIRYRQQQIVFGAKLGQIYAMLFSWTFQDILFFYILHPVPLAFISFLMTFGSQLSLVLYSFPNPIVTKKANRR